MEKATNCPVCGKELVKDSCYCYHCGRFLDESRTRVLGYGEVNDDDLRRIVATHDAAWEKYHNAKGTKITMVTLIICIIVVLVGAGVMIFAHNMTLGGILAGAPIFIAVIVGIIFSVPSPKEWFTDPDYKMYAQLYILPGLWDQVFDEVQSYEWEDGIGEAHLKQTKLIQDHFTNCHTLDLLKAVWHGMPLTYSTVALSRETNRDADDHRPRESQPIFTGFWISMKTQLHPLAKVQFRDRRSANLWWSREIASGDEFINAFSVETKDPDYKADVLSAQDRETLLEIRRKSNGRVFLSVDPDGTVELGIDLGRRPMKIKNIHEDPEELRSRLRDDLLQLPPLLELVNRLEL